jgi:excisionase family DNA binding protein
MRRLGTEPAPQVEPRTTAVPSHKFEPLLDDVQAGKLLRMHPKTVQRKARRGELPAIRIGVYWYYRESQLDAWVVLHSTSQNNPPAHNRKETQ